MKLLTIKRCRLFPFFSNVNGSFSHGILIRKVGSRSDLLLMEVATTYLFHRKNLFSLFESSSGPRVHSRHGSIKISFDFPNVSRRKCGKPLCLFTVCCALPLSLYIRTVKYIPLSFSRDART